MAQINRLTAVKVGNAGEGVYADGGNLYLRVRGESRKWVFRYKRGQKPVEIGLGSVNTRTLKQARDIASKMRTALADGKDPASVLARPAADGKSFKVYALQCIEERKARFKNAKHLQQWENTLEQYAFPIIGDKQPRDVTLLDMKAILNAPQPDEEKEPFWYAKTETASRVRQRIETIIDFAAVHDGDEEIRMRNPARWKGNLDHLFPHPKKVAAVEHHAAADYKDVPGIMAALREKDCTSAYCLRWTILTATRSTEARAAVPNEINEAAKMWVIPASRMKAKREHKIPLSDEAMEILGAMKKRKIADCPYLFPGANSGLLSDVAINKTLHSIMPDVTVHGFRSSFREWGEQQTKFSSKALEKALAHLNRDKVEAAYQRNDLYELRREIMTAWDAYLSRKSNIVPFAKSISAT